MLQPANFYRFVIDIMFVPYQLPCQMDSFAFTCECILMHDGNYFFSLGWYNTHNSSNRYVNYLVIVNTLDLHLPSSLVDDSYIFTCNTTIISAVNQGSLSNILVTGDIVHDFGHVHLSLGNIIYVDL